MLVSPNITPYLVPCIVWYRYNSRKVRYRCNITTYIVKLQHSFFEVDSIVLYKNNIGGIGVCCVVNCCGTTKAYKKEELDLIDNKGNCKEKGTESLKPKLLILKDVQCRIS